MWETCICTIKMKQATSIAYPQLAAHGGSPLPEGSSEWGGAHSLACSPVWPHLSLSPAQVLCSCQWDTFLVLCVDLAFLSSSRFPVLVLSPDQDQAFLLAQFRWLLYNGVFGFLFLFCAGHLALRAHCLVCSAVRLWGPPSHSLWYSRTQESSVSGGH